MFAKLVIVLYAVYIPLMCSCISQATTRAPVLSDCFPHTGTKVKKDWRYTYTKSKANGPVFDEELEAGVNEQINYELSAHYTYLSMSYHFDEDEHYMPGFSKFFKQMAEEEHEHAQKFMKYQNKRGGKIRLNSIPQPCEDGNWGNGTMAMRKALHLENTINYLLLNLHVLGDRKNEAQFLDFLESKFLGEQVDSIKQLSNYVHILERLDSSLGEYQFDKLTLGGGKE